MTYSSVKLIAVSKPVVPECDTAQDLIAYCARVSNPSNQGNKETARNLIKYLIKHKHWSPLEMVHVTMEIITSRDIARQILRHRSFSFQEFSQRYAKAYDFVIRDARLQDEKNRQNSIETDDDELKNWWYTQQAFLIDEIKKTYDKALSKGIAKECARSILPEGCTISRMYMAGSLRSWYHYCDLRRGNGTQKEHQEVAEQCWNILCEEFPILKELNDD